MSRPPVLKPREVVSLLQKLGFVEVRQKDSHKQFRHPDGRSTTVPFHAGRHVAALASTDCERHSSNNSGDY
jgi:predicted RNA binding protein YcfA (HicA-like mRNA interferase family)